MPKLPATFPPPVIVLAGGLGTRLSTTVPGLPKVLAPINGKPFLGYLLPHLKKQGIRRVVLSLGHLHTLVEDFLNENAFAGLEISTIIEDAPLGTAGGLKKAFSVLNDNAVMVLNGDSFCDASLESIFDSHLSRGASISLVATSVPDTSRYGRLEIKPGGDVMAFHEKSDSVSPGFINAGIYVFNRSVIEAISSNEKCSLETDILPAYCNQGLVAYFGEFRFIDIGTEASFHQAQTFFNNTFI